MKIAYIMPHSYEYFYPKEMENYNSSQDLETNILRKSDDFPHRYCKASILAGMESKFYYLSSTARDVTEFNHDYGHKMVKIPVNLKIGKYGRYGWEFSSSLFRTLSQDDFDLIFIFTYQLNRFTPLDLFDLLSFFCRKNNYPFIARHAGGSIKINIRGVPLFYRRWVKKYTLGLANKIVTPSETELPVFKDYFKINSDKLIYLQNPVDLENFKEISKNCAAEVLNKDPSKNYLLFVGRLYKGKGIQHVIQIFPNLLKKYHNLNFLIVGSGPFEKYLRKMVIDKGLENHIIFVGQVFHSELKYYYNIADIFLLPSYSEGIPNVLQEAIACNTSSIGTDVGFIPEMLSDGLGLVIKKKDNKALYYNISQILDGNFEINQDKRNKLLKEWSLIEFGKKLSDIYKGVLDYK